MLKLRQAVLIWAIALLTLVPGSAQYHPREVTGLVTDKRGNALPGAAVQLENTANLAVRSYITGKDGRYHFAGLNDNVDFTLRAKYRRFWSPQKTLSKFNSSTHPEVDLVIPID